VNAGASAAASDATGAPVERLSGLLDIGESTVVPLDGMVPITAPRATVTLDNNALDIAIPEAFALLPGNRKVPIKGGSLKAGDVIGPRPDSEISFNVQAGLAPFLEALETLPIAAIKAAAPFPKAADGKVDAQMSIKLPLISHLRIEDVAVGGKAKIADGRFGKVGGQFDIQGFTLALDLNETALDAKGDLIVNGVPAKIAGQRVLNASAEEQPPLKITADLDATDRNQLGLDINDLVHGTVPVEVTVQKGPRAEPNIKLKADLTGAELEIEQIAWKKAPGRAATLETDIATGKNHKTELQNFKLAGDDIAVEGWVGIGADNKMKEFFFPEFTLNVVSRLQLQGTRGGDGVWAIKAQGTTFDGRDFFKSLFSVGDTQKAKPQKPAAGIDLNASIDNVIGHSDISLRGLKLKLGSRGERLVNLDARGMLDGGAPLAAVLDGKAQNGRRLLADSTDAGTTMKLLDFYPNVQGGRLKLEVNLDGKGPAEKTGILWVEDFKVLGDPIVSEVVGSADQGRPAIQGRRNVTREVFNFDRLRAPFSIGYGQFVLEDSYLKGPLLGANLRGKVDFKVRRLNLGGTYIPLQGLNSALGGIPVLGQLISGTHGEGVFGITFAVQGPLSDPQVIVNPLSLVAPGIFREMFQMTTANPKVQVREDRAPAKPVEERVRANAPPAAPPVFVEPQPKPKKGAKSEDAAAQSGPPVFVEPPPAPKKGAKAADSTADGIDGWSSTTSPRRN
ncbi:MAG: AsmA-like C-terminal region-containing protein, partial [Hyphomicrobium sp.]